ncbi:MAG: hypothetical protein KDB27_21860 [Planctomycetales bacterium]|nr:hypothetical protein [Planctomycetales bacterium]
MRKNLISKKKTRKSKRTSGRKGNANTRRRLNAIEKIEDRVLMAADVALIDETLQIVGDDDANSVQVHFSTTDAGSTIDVQADGETFTFAEESVSHISVELNGGDDRLQLSGEYEKSTPKIATRIDAGAGNDTVSIGRGIDVQLNVDLGTGSDELSYPRAEISTHGLTPGEPAITIQADRGDNTVLLGPQRDAPDRVDLQAIESLVEQVAAGLDQFDTEQAALAEEITAAEGRLSEAEARAEQEFLAPARALAEQVADGESNDEIQRLNSKADDLIGPFVAELNALRDRQNENAERFSKAQTSLSDQIDTTLTSLEAADDIAIPLFQTACQMVFPTHVQVNISGSLNYNGNLNLLVVGAGTNDTIVTGSGNDTILAGAGNDWVWSGSGHDRIEGQAGADHLFGQADNDCVRGGTETDWVYGNSGHDELSGGTHRDYIFGYGGNDRMFGDGGSDIMWGGSDRDFMRGGDDRDYMLGSSGNDQLYGDNGNDWMRGNTDFDYMRGGNGNDTMWGDQSRDVIIGGNDHDLIYGGDGDDHLLGLNGHDQIRGENGSDYLNGGNDSDWLLGGDGNDVVVGGAQSDVLWGNGGHDNLYGEAGADWMFGNDGNDRMFGGTDNDLMWGNSGDDCMQGNAGNDIMRGDAGNDCMKGNDGHDRMWGDTGNDCMEGGAGNDWIWGLVGNDTMHGNDGHDRLWGGDGQDSITDGSGYDLVWGENGNDLIVLVGDSDTDVAWGGNGIDAMQGTTGSDWFVSNAGPDDFYQVGGVHNLIGSFNFHVGPSAQVPTCQSCIVYPWLDFATVGDIKVANDLFNASFDGLTTKVVEFDGLSGLIPSDHFKASHGVTIENIKGLGVGKEGDPNSIEQLDMYDGEQDGSAVLATFPNHVDPITIRFDEPVAAVGSFIATGSEGGVNTLTVEAFDTDGNLVHSQKATVTENDDPQNREGHWLVSLDENVIAKVVIQNNNTTPFGYAAIFGDISYGRVPTSPTVDPDDINQDGKVDASDLDLLCSQVVEGTADRADVNGFLSRRHIPVGDANFDGEFNSGDLVAVFSAGTFESAAPATWSTGDWNCDGQFDTTDFVAAFSAGHYEQGPLRAVAAGVNDLNENDTAEHRSVAARDQFFAELDRIAQPRGQAVVV